MSWVVTAVVGTAAVSNYLTGKSAEEAAGTVLAGQQLATAETGRQFDVAQANLAPYREIGEEFLPQLRDFLRGDYKGFLESPDFKFVQEQGELAIGRKQAATGSRFGGRALKEAARFSTGLASTRVNDYFNKLFNVVGLGSSAAAGTAQAAIQTGQTNAAITTGAFNNLANIQQQRGINQANTVTGLTGNLLTLQAYNNLTNVGAAGGRPPPPPPAG